LLTPEQQSYLSSAMRGTQQMAQPMDPAQFQQMFQQSFVDPAQQMLQRQIVPGIKEQFMGMDESGSSALNQALAQSATDLSTVLGSQLMNQYGLGQQRQLGALGQLGGLAGQHTFQPWMEQNPGFMNELIKAAATLGGAALI